MHRSYPSNFRSLIPHTSNKKGPKPNAKKREKLGFNFQSMSFFSILLSFLLFLHISSFLAAPNSKATTLSDCPKKCGNVEIHYPFGIGDGCFLPGFKLRCNQTTPLLSNSNIQLLEILEGEVRINSTMFIATHCRTDSNAEHVLFELWEDSPYMVSITSNQFVTIGYNAAGIVTDNETTLSQCVTKWFEVETIDNGSCTGRGCCSTSIPSLKKKKMYLYVEEVLQGWNTFKSTNMVSCNYGFVVEDDGGFTFDESDLEGFNRNADISMRLEWAVGDLDCEEAGREGLVFCGESSDCVDSKRGSGYICRCSDGFQGNPYLNGSQGCQDIDECLNSSHCVPEATCKNEVPGFRCTCPAGSSGDGLIHGSGCTRTFPIIRLVLGLGLSILVLMGGSSWLYWALKKRKLIKLRERFFQQNGGLLLQNQLSSRGGRTTETNRIFTSEELQRATNNYDDNRIIGKGGFGTVYKGILDDLRVVAIKKSKVVDKAQIQQFINEVVILTQINHRNVVKLLGCCLDTEVPLLVYEYVSNGTLQYHLHGNTVFGSRISWEDRLRIAIETAEALAYLHSSTSMPIFHRDVKSSNILLDENYTTKVSDFGVSRLVPRDKAQITTLVQGTLGYLDPEYFQTSQLTAKSDVYSFGVVLVELLTGQKPISFDRSEDCTNLAMYFISTMRTSKLKEILEAQVLREERMDQVHAVAEIAFKCLRLKGEKRPTMKEVAQELACASLKGIHQHSQEDMMCWSSEHEKSNSSDWMGDETFSGEFLH